MINKYCWIIYNKSKSENIKFSANNLYWKSVTIPCFVSGRGSRSSLRGFYGESGFSHEKWTGDVSPRLGISFRDYAPNFHNFPKSAKPFHCDNPRKFSIRRLWAHLCLRIGLPPDRVLVKKLFLNCGSKVRREADVSDNFGEADPTFLAISIREAEHVDSFTWPRRVTRKAGHTRELRVPVVRHVYAVRPEFHTLSL